MADRQRADRRAVSDPQRLAIRRDQELPCEPSHLRPFSRARAARSYGATYFLTGTILRQNAHSTPALTRPARRQPRRPGIHRPARPECPLATPMPAPEAGHHPTASPSQQVSRVGRRPGAAHPAATMRHRASSVQVGRAFPTGSRAIPAGNLTIPAGNLTTPAGNLTTPAGPSDAPGRSDLPAARRSTPPAPSRRAQPVLPAVLAVTWAARALSHSAAMACRSRAALPASAHSALPARPAAGARPASPARRAVGCRPIPVYLAALRREATRRVAARREERRPGRQRRASGPEPASSRHQASPLRPAGLVRGRREYRAAAGHRRDARGRALACCLVLDSRLARPASRSGGSS